MSAPGLDLQIAEHFEMPASLFRTSVNFMGCYAAIHAMKLASLIVAAAAEAKVLVVCTELCTLHFQKEYTPDNVSSSLLFSDGAAAALIQNDSHKGFTIQSFYSEIATNGKADMSWKLSSKGFLMSLSSYVADIIKADIKGLIERSAAKAGVDVSTITHWCIHPGGRKILESVEHAMQINKTSLQNSYDILYEYGNMSSPTILFVLQRMMREAKPGEKLLGCAFGPGLTMETFVGNF